MKINTVTILGANGTMGTNVAAIFASFGEAKVYLVSRNIEDSIEARTKAALSVRAEAIKDNLIPKTYSEIEECVKNSDLVFESVAEDINIKKQVYNMISPFIKEDAIVATGTSGLSINKLSEFLPEKNRKNFVGMHFFNPPYKMTLCEVIASEYSDKAFINNIKFYLKTKLIRTVVEVKDKPAFIGNRVGFQFINEALILAEKYKEDGGIDYIDAIFCGITGRSMPPLVTSDFVGLDVHKAIVDNVYNNTNDYERDSFKLPNYVIDLIKENKLGRKVGCGLYRKNVDENGNKVYEVFDISTKDYRKVKKYDFSYISKMKLLISRGQYTKAVELLLNDKSKEANICLHMLLKYVLYGLYITKTIGEDIHSSDHVMATGFNWIPPLALITAFEGGGALF